jgi:hypothetical protein
VPPGGVRSRAISSCQPRWFLWQEAGWAAGWFGRCRAPTGPGRGEACLQSRTTPAPASSRPCDSTLPSLASSGMVLAWRPPSPSRHPSVGGGHRRPGCCSPGAWSWWRWSAGGGWRGRLARRPVGRQQHRRPLLRDPAPHHHDHRRADGLGGVQGGGRPGQRDARQRRQAAGGAGRARQDPARPGNRRLSGPQLLERVAPALEAGSSESDRFDRALAAYRQVVDQCKLQAP